MRGVPVLFPGSVSDLEGNGRPGSSVSDLRADYTPETLPRVPEVKGE